MGSEGRTRLALLGLMVATSLAFGQVIDGSGYWGPAALGMLVATAIMVVARRAGTGAAIGVGVSSVVMIAYLAFIFRAGATFYGLPTPAAIGGLLRSVQSAARFSNVDFAPVPPRAGYVILTVVAMWLLVTWGEIATFRWRRPMLASLPAVGLFAILLVLGTGVGAGFLIALWLAALTTYWGVESAHRLRSWGRWVSALSHICSDPVSTTGGTARRMTAGCIAAALISPVFLPALQDGLVSWRNKTADGSGGRRALNPLVSLLPQLIDPGNQERFRVTTPNPTYYRVVTLSRFDGTNWHPAPDPDVLLDQVPIAPEPVARAVVGATTTEAASRADFLLTGLAGQRLPAPQGWVEVTSSAMPEHIDDMLTNRETRDLRLDGGIPPNFEYNVAVVDPELSFGRLKNARIGRHDNDDYTDDPNLSPEVLALVDDWTEDAGGPFEKLVAIQDRFRSDFTYSLRVEASASRDYLTFFLTESKQGYCQQFATAFALLARSLGYPSRVVAGYLPGVPDPGIRSQYIVGDFEAHAWPEVYFEDVGWLRFEPTPRSDVTVVRPAYTSPAGRDGAGALISTGTGGGGAGNGVSAAQREQIRANLPGAQPRVALPETPPAPREPRWQKTFVRVTIVLVAALLVFAVAVPAAKRWSVRRRYRQAASSNDLAAAAFAEFEFEAAELAITRSASESAVAFAGRVARMDRVPGAAALQLARIYEQALFGPSGLSADSAREARRLARSLSSLLWKTASWWQRAQRLFSPRALAPAHRRLS